MTRAKSPAVREAEKRVDRRRDEIVEHARTYRAVRAGKGDTRSALSDLVDAVDDYETASRELGAVRASERPAAPAEEPAS